MNIIEILLSYGAQPNAQDHVDLGGNTPLHLATEKNMKDAVMKIMSFGGDAEIPNQTGFSCLHIAAREGHTDLVKIFKAKDVNLD